MNRKLYKHSLSEIDEKLIKLGLINNFLAGLQADVVDPVKRLDEGFEYMQQTARSSIVRPVRNN